MIINADDFGYSESVNEAICQCFNRGLINRTTIMVNMPEAENAAEIAKNNGFFHRVGLHINLTEGRAMTEECRNSSLCDEKGCFKGTFHVPIKARFFLDSATKRAIYAEVKAQMEKYISMGFSLMHADSHNYTHVYFSVYSPVKKLLKKYGFTSVRISRNIPENSFSMLFKVYKGIFNLLIKNLRVNGKKVFTKRYFGSIQDLLATGNIPKYKDDIEIMTHPDIIDGVLTDNTLPEPHAFVDENWLREKDMVLDTTSGNKLKLLVCFIQEHIGGAMTSFVNFVNALDTDKYDVDVIFYENKTRCGIKEEINLLPQGKVHTKFALSNIAGKMFSPSYVIAKIKEFHARIIQKNKLKAVQIMSQQGYKYSAKLNKEYDIAVAYELSWALNYVTYRVNARKKLVWHHMDYENAGFDYSIDKDTFSKVDGLVFVSDECRKTFSKNHPELKDKTYFVPNLLSSDYVRAKGNAFEAEKIFETNDKSLRFLSVSRINYTEKALDRAVRVFKRLKDNNLLGNVFWTIIGKGDKLEELRSMVADFGLSEHIKLLGVKENPIPYMKNADIIFLPSKNEGKPMVITEGFIMGLVPVVTEYTSAHEQIKNGYDGLVFENSEDGLYDGLKKVLEDPSCVFKLKENVKNNDYGNESEIKVFDNLINKLIN